MLSESGKEELSLKIMSAQRLVEESVEIVHRFARSPRPSALDDLGLIPALESFIKTFMEESGIRTTLVAFAGIENTDISIRRTTLYRVAEEALTLAARHTGASQVEATIHPVESTFRMEIRDDGEDFEVESTSCAWKTVRLGILGMKERIEMIGGEFNLVSTIGADTVIMVEIPSDITIAFTVKAPEPFALS